MQFQELKHKISQSMRPEIIENAKVVFARSYVLERFNLKTKEELAEMLIERNCKFVVYIKYCVDDPTHSEYYEIEQKIAVVHPKYFDSIESILLNDMNSMVTPISRIQFERKNKINTIRATTETLESICKCIFGIVSLFSGNDEIAFKELVELEIQLNSKKEFIQSKEILLSIVCHYKYLSVLSRLIKVNQKYSDTYDPKYLDQLEKILETLSNIIPNTYEYYICSAFLQVMKYDDGEKAEDYILSAKRLNLNSDWKFSYAFLGAYYGEKPFTILNRYKAAFKDNRGYNINEIICNTEKCLEDNPTRCGLHFALGLLYEDNGDIYLMKKHFLKYKNYALDNGLDKKIIQLIEDKMNKGTCNNKYCDNDCISCKCTA